MTLSCAHVMPWITSRALAGPVQSHHKPHPHTFAQICAVMLAQPGSLAFVGDSLANDIAGASAAGMVPVWIDRFGGGYPMPAGVHTISSLWDLPGLLKALSRQ